jgi:hypothetical protein
MSFRRDHIHFRVNTAERHNIRALAQLRHLSVSELIRRRILSEVDEARSRDEMYASMYPQRAKNYERWL